ncbi:MAG: TolC family protein [Opitutales bacterium]
MLRTRNSFIRTQSAILSAILAGATALPGASDPEGDSLIEIWKASSSAQPRYLAGTLRVEAEALEARALAREEWPSLTVEAGGDYGQRARPGEEREQGIAGRGEILAQVNWNLMESGRSARERALNLRREGLEQANAAFDDAFRTEVARSYVNASLALERRKLLRAARIEFSEMAKLVLHRFDEGVEPGATRDQLEQREAAWAARWREADTDAETARLQLALLAGREEVRPLPVQLLNLPEEAPTLIDRLPPALAALELQAKEGRAQAEAIALTNRWRLNAIGQTGPYFSRAYDGRIEEEYYAGLRFTWSPDAAGVQRTRARAEMRRARSLEAEKTALQRDYAQSSEAMRRTFRELSRQEEEWTESLTSAQAAERAAQLRWREGVGTWITLLEERNRLLEVRLGELAWRERLARTIIDYAESTGQVHELPAWIGQTPGSSL